MMTGNHLGSLQPADRASYSRMDFSAMTPVNTVIVKPPATIASLAPFWGSVASSAVGSQGVRSLGHLNGSCFSSIDIAQANDPTKATTAIAIRTRVKEGMVDRWTLDIPYTASIQLDYVSSSEPSDSQAPKAQDGHYGLLGTVSPATLVTLRLYLGRVLHLRRVSRRSTSPLTSDSTCRPGESSAVG